MDPALEQLIEAGAPDEEVSAIIRLVDPSRVPDTVRVVCRFGNIVTVRLLRADVQRTWDSDLVASMKASRPVVAPLPFEDDPADFESMIYEAPETQRLPGGGEGVVLGVCDWGIDFTHPNFRNDDGSTRLLALWDQRGRGGVAPEPYRYGRVHTRDEINAALAQPDPFGALGYDLHANDPANLGSHGTHVCDIAAGNRRLPGSRVGLASRAEIVFVQLTSQQANEPTDFGDSVSVLEALDFVRRISAGKPCVINVSAGKTGGEHWGTNPFEQAVDAMLLERDNLALVQSVGNYAMSAMHTHARLGPDQRHTLQWQIHRGDRTINELEIWYSGKDIIDVTVVSPQGQRFSVQLGGKLRLEDGAQHWGNLYHRLKEPNSGLNHIDIFVRPSAPAGTWRIELIGREIVDGRLHAWIERDAAGHHQSRFAAGQATPNYTTNTICNSLRGIAVGAYDPSAPDRPPAPFSSRGPTADGRQKPEIAAPGQRIRAARSMPDGGWGPDQSQHTLKSGTSMASPHVAGTVALMYQAAARPLSINEVRRILIGTADPHPGPAGRSSSQLGYGYLNTEAAVAAVRRLTAGGSTWAETDTQEEAPADVDRDAPDDHLGEVEDEDVGDAAPEPVTDIVASWDGYAGEVDPFGLDHEAAFRAPAPSVMPPDAADDDEDAGEIAVSDYAVFETAGPDLDT